jgi:hypothetical protein
MSGQSSDDIIRGGDLMTIVIREKASIDWSGLASMIGLAVALDKPIIPPALRPRRQPLPLGNARRVMRRSSARERSHRSSALAVHASDVGRE